MDEYNVNLSEREIRLILNGLSEMDLTTEGNDLQEFLMGIICPEYFCEN